MCSTDCLYKCSRLLLCQMALLFLQLCWQNGSSPPDFHSLHPKQESATAQMQFLHTGGFPLSTPYNLYRQPVSRIESKPFGHEHQLDAVWLPFHHLLQPWLSFKAAWIQVRNLLGLFCVKGSMIYKAFWRYMRGKGAVDYSRLPISPPAPTHTTGA